MSIIYGGVEYKSGDVTDYLFSQKELRLKCTPAGQMMYLYNNEYGFLASSAELADNFEFCSCLLYENIINQLAENVSPSLEYAIENSKYREDEWYQKLVKLEQQLAEWPTYRARHVEQNKIYDPEKYIGFTKYWKLLDVEPPVFNKIRLPEFLTLPADQRTDEDYKKWMELLLSAESAMLPAIRNFEMKLYDCIGKL